MADKPTIQLVNDIPDLITWDDYEEVEAKKLVRVQLRVTENGVELIADSPYPKLLEELLEKLGPEVIETLICG